MSNDVLMGFECWIDNIKEWTFLSMQELLTRASCGKGWNRISAKSSFMSPRRPDRSRTWTELNCVEKAKSSFNTSWRPNVMCLFVQNMPPSLSFPHPSAEADIKIPPLRAQNQRFPLFKPQVPWTWWYSVVSRSSGLAKTILQGTVKGGKYKADRGRGGKTSGNGQAWSSASRQMAVENRDKWMKLDAKSTVVPQRPSRLRDWWWWWWISGGEDKTVAYTNFSLF